MTHQELVKRAERWLLGTMRCYVVLTEQYSIAPERPDAIGWNYQRSILVECKTSRADYQSDIRKFSRSKPSYGMGNFRFYLTPPGLLVPDEIPERWGLLEARRTQIRVIKNAAAFQQTERYERIILVAALRGDK